MMDQTVDIPLGCAIIGLVFEVIGLLTLFLPDRKQSLEAMVRNGIDGLDDWQQDITKLVTEQRRRHGISSVFIVLGILLQTFPEYYFQ